MNDIETGVTRRRDRVVLAIAAALACLASAVILATPASAAAGAGQTSMVPSDCPSFTSYNGGDGRLLYTGSYWHTNRMTASCRHVIIYHQGHVGAGGLNGTGFWSGYYRIRIYQPGSSEVLKLTGWMWAYPYSSYDLGPRITSGLRFRIEEIATACYGAWQGCASNDQPLFLAGW